VPLLVKLLPTPVMVIESALVVSVPRLTKLPPPVLTVMVLSELTVTAPLLPATVLPMTTSPVVLRVTGEPSS
jgi:hypothetical protein